MKTCTDQNRLQVIYSDWKETFFKPLKVVTGKRFSPLIMLMVQHALLNVFYSVW